MNRCLERRPTPSFQDPGGCLVPDSPKLLVLFLSPFVNTEMTRHSYHTPSLSCLNLFPLLATKSLHQHETFCSQICPFPHVTAPLGVLPLPGCAWGCTPGCSPALERFSLSEAAGIQRQRREACWDTRCLGQRKVEGPVPLQNPHPTGLRCGSQAPHSGRRLLPLCKPRFRLSSS